jgi:hypothetical protein
MGERAGERAGEWASGRANGRAGGYRRRRHHAFDGGILRVGGEGLRYGRMGGFKSWFH